LHRTNMPEGRWSQALHPEAGNADLLMQKGPALGRTLKVFRSKCP
jgi:hypothetical protein